MEYDQNGLDDDDEELMENTPVTPVTADPLIRQESKDSSSSKEDQMIRRPSTIFSSAGNGEVVSPWGPPTKFVFHLISLNAHLNSERSPPTKFVFHRQSLYFILFPLMLT